ncbi:hypothetical protein LINPERHAP1_LOCUS19087, partial [Linum perenne]
RNRQFNQEEPSQGEFRRNYTFSLAETNSSFSRSPSQCYSRRNHQTPRTETERQTGGSLEYKTSFAENSLWFRRNHQFSPAQLG